MLYKTTSKGGIKAANKLIAEIITQLDADPDAIVPIVALKMDSYKHKEYGKIYTPIFEIESFTDFNGLPATPAEPDDDDDIDEPEQSEGPADEPVPQLAPQLAARKRKTAETAAEPAPATRRRRPVAH